MPDYCVDCGDKDSENSDGYYVEFSTDRKDIEPIYTELWVCNDCMDNRRLP